MFSFIGDFFNYNSRKIDRTTVNGLVISTCNTSDEGYETAILDSVGTHPVERYASKEDAEEGHKKWVEKATLPVKLTRITKLSGFGDLVPEEVVKLIPFVVVPLDISDPV